MASYIDLYTARVNDNDSKTLQHKVEVALWIEAESILETGVSPADDDKIRWAYYFLNNSKGEASKVLNLLFGKNNTATTAQILSATDASIQTNVTDVVANLIKGFVLDNPAS